MKKVLKTFKKPIDSQKNFNIIRLILKSGDQLFECLFIDNGELIWLV